RIVPVSVNVSARQFRHGVVDLTASVLRRTGLDPRYLELELTESAAMDSLKIDKAFIQAQSLADASIVAAIIAMAHSLGLKVVAEGVETEAQLAYLAEKSCDEVQGFLFSKPVPAEEFRRMLAGGPAAAKVSSNGSLLTAVRTRRVRATA